jgi:phosphatidate cytidylyltransferase
MSSIHTTLNVYPVIERLLWVFGTGFLLVVVFNIKNLKGIFNSEAWKRYLGWLLIAPVFLTGVVFGGLISILITGFLMYSSIREFTLMEELPSKFYVVLLMSGLLSMLVAIFKPEIMLMLPFLYLVITAGVAIFTKTPQNMIHKVYIVLFGSVWICYSIPHMCLFRTIENGQGLLVLIGFAVALSDIGTYSFGKLFNKIGLGGAEFCIAQNISPNKTWIGTAGAFIGAATATVMFSGIAGGLNAVEILLITIAVAICAVTGDLTESLVKRSCGTKDSGTLIMGHGGILDRIDSFLFSIVIIYHLKTFL